MKAAAITFAFIPVIEGAGRTDVFLYRAGEFRQPVGIDALADHCRTEILILGDLFFQKAARWGHYVFGRGRGTNIGFGVLMLHTCGRSDPTLISGNFYDALPTFE